MRKTWRTWLWMLLSCAAMGAIPAAIEFAFRNVSLRHAAYSALDGFVYARCIGIPCWFLVPRAACRLNLHSPPTRFAAMAGLLAAFGVAGCFLANVILIGIGLVDAGAFAATWWWSLKVCLMITFSFGAVSLAIS